MTNFLVFDLLSNKSSPNFLEMIYWMIYQMQENLSGIGHFHPLNQLFSDYCTGQCKYKTRILSSLVKCSCSNRANLLQNMWYKQNNSVANINSDHNVTVSDYCLNFLWRGISILFIDILLNFQTKQTVTWNKRSWNFKKDSNCEV